jgi:hypothetical protein
MAVTFSDTDDEDNTIYTCFTRNSRFIVNSKNQITEYANYLEMIPIIEWVRSYDRMGVFEKQMDELDNLNVLVSDFTNDVDQNTNAIIHTNDIEPPLVEVEKEVLKDDGTVEIVKDLVERKYQPGEWVRTYTTQDGNKPIIEAITSDYDYSGMLSNILARRNLILQKCHVPITTDKTNGATGVAMDAATGWSDAETIASAQELITNGCYIEEVRVVLCAIRESVDLAQDSILRNLRACDVKPNVRRPKTYEMSIKVNSMATLIKTGFAVEDVVGTIPLFDDPSSVILTSGDGVRKYQETIFTQNEQSE